MPSRFLLQVALLFGLSMTASAQAPFCVVTTYTRDCGSYYDSQTCREQAAAQGGICVVNQDAQPARPAQPSQGPQGIDFGATSRGQRQAQEANRAEQQERREAEEHVARMRMLQAQREAAQAAQAPAPAYSAPSAASGALDTDAFGEAGMLHRSCLALIETLEQRGSRETSLLGGYCYGTLKGMIAGHSLHAKSGAAATFCLSEGSLLEMVRKLVEVPPADRTEKEVLYVRDRLVADWPC